MNETLCPTDFKEAGQIVDDELNQALINLVPQGVSLSRDYSILQSLACPKFCTVLRAMLERHSLVKALYGPFSSISF